MSPTAAFVIQLPQDAAEYVQQRIADGGFESPSDYVETLVVSDMLSTASSETELDQWMNTEGARRIEALHADPTRELTAEEAFLGLLGGMEDKERAG